jgi:hypothetical protein
MLEGHDLNVSGFYINPKTLIVDRSLHKLIPLCITGGEMLIKKYPNYMSVFWDCKYSAPELMRKKIGEMKFPDKISDVYGIGKTIELLWKNEPVIGEWISKSLESYKKKRISLDDVENKLEESYKKLKYQVTTSNSAPKIDTSNSAPKIDTSNSAPKIDGYIPIG